VDYSCRRVSQVLYKTEARSRFRLRARCFRTSNFELLASTFWLLASNFPTAVPLHGHQQAPDQPERPCPELRERHPEFARGAEDAATIALTPLAASDSERLISNLVGEGDGWRIEGAGSACASVAYACLDGERLVFEVAR